tara:strand:+ start:325 stop:624 length:300 start_codon:yes stop_codon:yes gene_type:complete
MKKFRFNQVYSVKNILQKITSNKLLSGGFKKVFLNKVWLSVMGKNVSQYTQDIFIKDETLFLKINSSALKQELSFGKEKIIENFNKEMGNDGIKRIVFI